MLQCGRPEFDPWVRKIPWRRKWQPTPVLLSGESHGGRSLVGYSPWGRKESETTEWLHSLFLYSPTLTSIHDYWKKTVALTRWTFVGKVMSLLLITLSRLVITFFPRSKHLLISWLRSPPVMILEAPKINSITVSTVSPSICHEVMGTNAMILVFWMFSLSQLFHSPLSLSSRGFLVPLHFLP